MPTYPFREVIPTDQLLLDQENPRLPEIAESQREAIHAMAKMQGNQMVELAKDIIEYGINPQKRLIVVPTDDEPIKYVVLDGNRRLSTIRVLETPEIITDQLNKSDLKKIKELAKKYHKDSIESFDCMVYKNRASSKVEHWINLEHRGQNKGRGTVEWNGQVSAAYDERRGKKSPALQVLRLLQIHNLLSAETSDRIDKGRFPVTTLDRILKTRYVQQKLGISKKKGNIMTKHRASDILAGLAKVTNDIGERKITVSDLKSETDRINYINNLPASVVPDPSTAIESEVPLDQINGRDDNSNGSDDGQGGKKRQRGGRRKKERTTVIGKKSALVIPHNRLNQIYVELKRLNCNDFENAAGAMLRVFIELSMDHFIDQKLNWSKMQKENSVLQSKMLGIIKYFESNSLLTKQELAGFKNASNKNSIIGPTYKTLHEYIHNYHITPVPTDLRNMWDSIEPVFKKIWS